MPTRTSWWWCDDDSDRQGLRRPCQQEHHGDDATMTVSISGWSLQSQSVQQRGTFKMPKKTENRLLYDSPSLIKDNMPLTLMINSKLVYFTSISMNVRSIEMIEHPCTWKGIAMKIIFGLFTALHLRNLALALGLVSVSRVQSLESIINF